jgi:hypothetical protein
MLQARDQVLMINPEEQGEEKTDNHARTAEAGRTSAFQISVSLPRPVEA